MNLSFLSQGRVSISDVLDGAARLPVMAFFFLFCVEVQIFFPSFFLYIYGFGYGSTRTVAEEFCMILLVLASVIDYAAIGMIDYD